MKMGQKYQLLMAQPIETSTARAVESQELGANVVQGRGCGRLGTRVDLQLESIKTL